jgi:hypothetical protein
MNTELIVEKKQLESRLSICLRKLEDDKTPSEEKDLLKKQVKLMKSYIKILDERLML